MTGRLADQPSPVEWGVAVRPMPGEVESGDAFVVRPFSGGALVAAIDGLGHGQEAAAAANIAVATLEAHAQEPVVSLVQQCHEALRRTRGVVMTLAAFDARAGTMTWLGVGNVEGVLIRANPGQGLARQSVLQRGGGLGFSLPPLRASVTTVEPGDTLILATDGIRSHFAEGLGVSSSPQGLAETILARYGKSTDDALVLVARYLGRTQ